MRLKHEREMTYNYHLVNETLLQARWILNLIAWHVTMATNYEFSCNPIISFFLEIAIGDYFVG